MTKRIVVLGASGFIGRRVVAALSSAGGFHTVAVSRRSSTAANFTDVETVAADLSAPGALRGLITDADGIVNCIAGSPELILASSAALLEAAGALKAPPRIVHLSSLAAYGSATGSVDEAAPLRGDLDAYSAAKAATDRMLSQYRSVVVLRPGIVFGPGSPWWSDRIARLLVGGRLGDLGRNGEGICNLIFVDDVAMACVLALRYGGPTPAAFNLSTPQPLTWNEYFARYGRALSVRPARIPAWRLAFETRVLALPLKALELLLAKVGRGGWNPWPPLRPWLPDLCTRRIRLDVRRAAEDLRLAWTPLDDALEVTADWFRDGGRTPA